MKKPDPDEYLEELELNLANFPPPDPNKPNIWVGFAVAMAAGAVYLALYFVYLMITTGGSYG